MTTPNGGFVQWPFGNLSAGNIGLPSAHNDVRLAVDLLSGEMQLAELVRS